MASLWGIRAGWWRLRLGWWGLKEQWSQVGLKDSLVELGRIAGRKLGAFRWLKGMGQRAGLVAPKDWDGSPHRSSPERQAETVRFLRAGEAPADVQPASVEQPLIFVSCCETEAPGSGGGKYSGGVKELNLLTRLLRRHGYEAWMVTSDGTFEPWLIEHAPHLSLAEYRERLHSGRPVRCVTSYAIAKAFIDSAPSLYFWDMELALSERQHLPILSHLHAAGKVHGAAAISRTIQAWTMARFGVETVTLPNLLDDEHFRPFPEKRIAGRVGYMNEGDHCEDYVAFVREYCAGKGQELTFVRVSGNEEECIATFATCDFFLSLNLGKDLFWGEGCPRTVIEAMSHGCVLLAFDVIGNREMIIDGFNGYLFPRYRIDLMAERLLELTQDIAKREEVRKHALSLAANCHKLEDRWPIVRKFLNLKGT